MGTQPKWSQYVEIKRCFLPSCGHSCRNCQSTGNSLFFNALLGLRTAEFMWLSSLENNICVLPYLLFNMLCHRCTLCISALILVLGQSSMLNSKGFSFPLCEVNPASFMLNKNKCANRKVLSQHQPSVTRILVFHL